MATDHAPTLDLILDNANVITVDPNRPRAGAIGIVGDRIAVVAEAGRLEAGSTTRVVDLGGPHRRARVQRRSQSHAGVRGCAQRDPARRRPLPFGGGDRGRRRRSGYRHAGRGVGGRHRLRRQQAGRAPTPDPPGARRGQPRPPRAAQPHVGPFLRGEHRGHAVGPDRRGRGTGGVGVVATGEDGAPNGLLEEQAQTLVRNLLHPRAVADMVENLGAASDAYLAEGITSCQEAGVGGILGTAEPLELAAYQRARREGRLRVRGDPHAGGRDAARRGSPSRRRPGWCDPRSCSTSACTLALVTSGSGSVRSRSSPMVR